MIFAHKKTPMCDAQRGLFMVREDGEALNRTLDVLAEWNRVLKGSFLDNSSPPQGLEPTME